MQEIRFRKGLSEEFLNEIVALADQRIPKEEYLQRKYSIVKKHALDKVPSDITILTHLSQEQLDKARGLLLTKPVRTGSGVTVVAVMTKPMRCPHGKCTYCPGGPNSHFGDIPQSYTGNEPASMRGKRAGWDIYVQIFNRLEQYLVSGHNPEKVELILMGGTFTSYPREYQDEVVHDIYQAMNDFSELFFRNEESTAEEAFRFDEFKEFFSLPGQLRDTERIAKVQERILAQKKRSTRYAQSIDSLQAENEHARIRCIGFTIETRPSHAKASHGQLMLEQGCTRVELGVQTTFDEVLEKVHRDHSVQDSIDSIADLRDLGFKLNFHVMLGLPLMTPERDLEAARRLFTDPAFQPDMIKIYPCMVMPGTPLYYEYLRGEYTPYTTEQAAALIAQIKRFIPSYVRVMRVQRDIPTTVTEAGVDKSNLRQFVETKCKEAGIKCRCIRCREIKGRIAKETRLNVIDYEASGGREFFISYECPEHDALLGFCRLRFPGRQLRSEITPSSAIIRELHVYGIATGIGDSGEVQHKGLGTKLVQEAERLAREHGKDKMLVISGIGVRQYYIQRLGYRHDGPYVSKRL